VAWLLQFIRSHLALKVEGSDDDDEVVVLCPEVLRMQLITQSLEPREMFLFQFGTLPRDLELG
jgi:hypothetical protein